jgi:hypothetical protein
MNTKKNDTSGNVTVTAAPSIAALERRLRRCSYSEQYVEVIRAIVATRCERAVSVLARLLDSTGPIAEESIAGLVSLAKGAGLDVRPAMLRCTDSDDYEMIRHGHRVLAALGDEASRAWLRADDGERVERFLDEKGFFDADERRELKELVGVANDDAEKDEGAARGRVASGTRSRTGERP